jgi:two-component system, OmpR family, response regulator
LVLGHIRLNPHMREISYKGQVLPFSRKEYLLIELFLRHPHRVFSRSDIVDHLWSLDNLPTDDTVKSHIRRIRRKLSQVGAEDLIETLYGHGYRINLSLLKQSPGSAVALMPQEKELTEAIEQVWQNIRPSILDQVASLEQAATLLEENALAGEQLKLAERTAHNLAGTVGSCGFEAASHIAKALEALLHQPSDQSGLASVAPLVEVLRFQLEQCLPAVESGQADGDELDLSPRPAEQPSASSIRILAIDDDPGIRTLLEQIFAVQGIQVIALPVLPWNALEVIQPDLLILDINMPTIDGLELCQTIRQTPRWQWLPILILTVRTDRQTIQEVFHWGADDYITKPIVPDELITRVLNRIRRSQELRSKLQLNNPRLTLNH